MRFSPNETRPGLKRAGTVASPLFLIGRSLVFVESHVFPPIRHRPAEACTAITSGWRWGFRAVAGGEMIQQVGG